MVAPCQNCLKQPNHGRAPQCKVISVVREGVVGAAPTARPLFSRLLSSTSARQKRRWATCVGVRARCGNVIVVFPRRLHAEVPRVMWAGRRLWDGFMSGGIRLQGARPEGRHRTAPAVGMFAAFPRRCPTRVPACVFATLFNGAVSF